MAGLLRVVSNEQLDRHEAEKRQREEADAKQNSPVITGLAAYVRRAWEPALRAKLPIEHKMLKAKRQRAGEYEPDKLAQIAAMGGSAIFMQLTEIKCRAAESWIRDILLDGGSPPWDLKPSPLPSLSPKQQGELENEFMQTMLELVAATGVAPEQQALPSMREAFEDDFKMRLMQAAERRCDRMADKIRDQFAEGGWYTAFNDFVTDLTTYPTAFVKGPVVRKQTMLSWETDDAGSMKPVAKEKLTPQFQRIDPFRMYPEPGVSSINEGYCFEHIPMSESDLSDLIGVPGYDENSIRVLLREGPRRSSWFNINEITKAELENKHQSWTSPTNTYDVLEFWGRVSGRMLLEAGMDEASIPDPERYYNACIWLCDHYVLKAMLNYDPLGNKPYTATSMFKVPGALWGRSIPEAVEDIQNVCNAAARSLVNNMGIASGPQVEVDIDRLPPGEDITQMYPWKIWQVTKDKSGGTAQAIRFTQPEDNAATLMAVYEKFARMADEHSGIPSYISGDVGVTGAGRTSSGLSMLMGAAGKGIRQVVSYIDNDVVKLMVTRQFIYNMRYDEDESIKGDAFAEPRGAINLAVRETAEVRRIEFLNATANPIDLEIMGVEGRGSVLREVAKSLQMPNEEVVPSKQKLKMRMAAAAAAPQSPAMPGPQKPEEPGAAPLPDGSAPGGASAAISRNQQTGAA